MESPLITHIFIEAYFNHDGLLTEEHLKSSEERKQLFESYGIFDGCKEAAEEIETAVIFKNNDNSPVITVSPKSLTFVNKVTVYLISEKIGKGAYDETKTKVNKDGTFDEIVIYLNNDTSSKEMITTLMHELTHAYQDYNLRKKETSLGGQAQKSGYGTTMEYVHGEKDNGTLSKNLATLFYLLNQFESSAYVTGLLNDVREALANNHFKNITDAVNYIRKHSRVFDYYNKVNRMTSKYCNPNLPLDIKQLIVKVAKMTSGYNFQNYKQVSNWLKSHTHKLSDKIERTLPKIVNDNMQVSEFMMPTGVADLILEDWYKKDEDFLDFEV